MSKLTAFAVMDGQVDTSAGIISKVSVITEGPALGHGLMIDRTTLQQVMDCAGQYANGVKVKMDHGSGAGEIVAALRNFRIEQRQDSPAFSVFADMHLLKAAAQYEYVLELAQEIPDTFGLSIVFSGLHEELSGQMFARCAEIYSCDIVSEPAANPSGLFSAVDTLAIGKMQEQLTALSAELETSKTTLAVREGVIAELKAALDITNKVAGERGCKVVELEKVVEEKTAELSKVVATLGETAHELETYKAKVAALEAAAKTVEERVTEEMGKLGQPPVSLGVSIPEPTRDELMSQYNELSKTNFAAARSFWKQHESRLQDPRILAALQRTK